MVQIAEISWSDAEKVFGQCKVALIPVGATEQHGPHNPLGTDHLLAAALAKKVGEETEVPVSPVIPVGISRHHRQFPGTLWVNPNTFREYMISIALSMADHGTTKIVFMNGHGGNNAALLEVCEDLRIDYGIFACMINSYPPKGLKGHGAAGETSQNLYYHPEFVNMEKAVDTVQNKKLGELEMKNLGTIGPASYPWDTIDFTDTGVLGGPGKKVVSTTASVEHGRELMEPYTKKVIDFINKLKEAKLEDLLPKPHKTVSK